MSEIKETVSTTEAKPARKIRKSAAEIPAPVLPEAPAPEPKEAEKEKPKKAKEKPVKADPALLLSLRILFPMLFQGVGVALDDPKSWKLSDAEMDMLVDPTGRILTRLGAAETVSKYGDAAALIAAAAIIVTPRIMATMKTRERKAPNAKKQNVLALTTGKPAESPNADGDHGNDQAVSGQPTEAATRQAARPINRNPGRSIKDRAGDGVRVD